MERKNIVMSLDAKIVYQYELDQLVASSRLEVMPLLSKLFEENPHAKTRDVLFTLESYLEAGNFESFPTLIQAPFDEAEEENEEVSTIEEIVEDKEPKARLTALGEPVIVKKPRRTGRGERTMATRDAGGKVNDSLDYRNLMNEVNRLEL